MATLSPQFNELLEADQKVIFAFGFNQQEEKWSKLAEKKTSTKAYEDGMRIVGLGTLVTKPEGTPIAFDDPAQGSRVRTVHTTYALGWRATMEMMMDDQHGIMNKMSSDLGESARDHRERLFWGMYDDFFTGTTYTGLESETMFSTTHTHVKTATTQSNMLSPAVALSTVGLEAMRTMAEITQSEEDRYIDVEQAVLVHHPNLKHQVDTLFDTQFEVDTSNNNINTVASNRTGFTSLSVPFITSTTAWTLHAPKGKNSITWNDRMPLKFFGSDDPDTQDRKHYAMYRASVMFREWRGNWGSNF
ncbi:MAG: hypothetical protein GY737_00330 [Desulfobacteraceae bacterium]|nr:hypothetical protein [Desulfobacteraceae bacterium]